MIIEKYDTHTGNKVETVTSLNFGSVAQGCHSPEPILLRCFKDSDTTIGSITISLENPGFSGTSFAIYSDATFQPDIRSGAVSFSDLTSSISIPVSDSTSNFIWLDVDAPLKQAGPTEASLRFLIS